MCSVVTDKIGKQNGALDVTYLKAEINRLKREKNAVIFAHYYQPDDIQEIADEIGDSLALAQKAAKTDADMIVLCGVHFMGETAKIINPDKKVLIPDISAGCSLANSCDAKEFEQFIKEHPGYTVISYVNTTAAVKTLTDVVVTSSNAVQIVNSLPKDEKIIFGPDRNLGTYVNAQTGRNMLLWYGCCHVHNRLNAETVLALKKEYPDALLLAHPECKKEVLDLADYAGSTAGILKFAQKSDKKRFLIGTESGILYKLRQTCPDKEFIPVPGSKKSPMNECNYMKFNTLEKLYNCLKDETPEVTVPQEVAEKAVRPIQRMLDISEQLGL